MNTRERETKEEDKDKKYRRIIKRKREKEGGRMRDFKILPFHIGAKAGIK